MPEIEFKEKAIKKKYSNDRMPVPLAVYKGVLPRKFVHRMKTDFELFQFVMSLINPHQ